MKKELTIALEKFKISIPNEFKDWVMENYGCFPSEFILNEKDIINRFVNLPIKQYLNIGRLSFFTKQYILKTNLIAKKRILKTYSVDELQELYIWNNPLINKIKKAEVEKLNNEIKLNGELGLILGYKMLNFLSESSVYYYLNKNPNSRDALHIKYADGIEEIPGGRNKIQQSLDRLASISISKYKNVSGDDSYNYYELYEKIWTSIENDDYFSDEFDENIIKATEKNQNYPERIKNNLIDEYKKYRKQIDYNTSAEEVLEDESKNLNALKDIEKASELKKLLSNIENQKDKNILELFLNGYTVREIQAKTGISKSSVARKLNKLVKK